MKKTKIKVFLADDHPVLLEGISLMLEPIPDIEVIGEASNGVELLEKLDQLTLQNALPDVILMDVDMPGLDGYQTTAALKKKYDDLKVLMLTIFDSQLDVQQARRVGADGFLAKRIEKKELVQAIRDCLARETFILHNPNPVAPRLSEAQPPVKKENSCWLTEREKKFIELIAKELSLEAIATQLHLSPLSLSALHKTLLSKLHVKTDAGMVKEALCRGLISVDSLTK